METTTESSGPSLENRTGKNVEDEMETATQDLGFRVWGYGLGTPNGIKHGKRHGNYS